MYQPVHPHIPKPPTKKLKLLAGASLIATGALVIILIALSFQLITQIHRTNSQQKAATELATALTTATDELTLLCRVYCQI